MLPTELEIARRAFVAADWCGIGIGDDPDAPTRELRLPPVEGLAEEVLGAEVAAAVAVAVAVVEVALVWPMGGGCAEVDIEDSSTSVMAGDVVLSRLEELDDSDASCKADVEAW